MRHPINADDRDLFPDDDQADDHGPPVGEPEPPPEVRTDPAGQLARLRAKARAGSQAARAILKKCGVSWK